MQVKDEAIWAEQLTEFEADDTSRQFRDFLVFWMDATDKVIDESDWYARDFSFAACVRKALEVAEQTMGFLSVEWIAQMLLVITQHWVYGEQLFQRLTFIERRLVEQATAMKLADLQMTASITTEE